eukprot:TRINITY_DN34240_c0_g2_i1.p1 TRINITY_DN34240_c0_g2~~TRINITY_DN34240_c0_g2_i1.p1  ORF type:complete len:343 (-),score=81.57 TRINITY_DN34240_c0_g2_i1:293-1321(-)
MTMMPPRPEAIFPLGQRPVQEGYLHPKQQRSLAAAHSAAHAAQTAAMRKAAAGFARMEDKASSAIHGAATVFDGILEEQAAAVAAQIPREGRVKVSEADLYYSPRVLPPRQLPGPPPQFGRLLAEQALPDKQARDHAAELIDANRALQEATGQAVSDAFWAQGYYPQLGMQGHGQRQVRYEPVDVPQANHGVVINHEQRILDRWRWDNLCHGQGVDVDLLAKHDHFIRNRGWQPQGAFLGPSDAGTLKHKLYEQADFQGAADLGGHRGRGGVYEHVSSEAYRASFKKRFPPAYTQVTLDSTGSVIEHVKRMAQREMLSASGVQAFFADPQAVSYDTLHGRPV